MRLTRRDAKSCVGSGPRRDKVELTSGHYTGKFWFQYERQCSKPDKVCGGVVMAHRAQINGYSSLGVGWTWDLSYNDPFDPVEPDQPRGKPRRARWGLSARYDRFDQQLFTVTYRDQQLGQAGEAHPDSMDISERPSEDRNTIGPGLVFIH